LPAATYRGTSPPGLLRHESLHVRNLLPPGWSAGGPTAGTFAAKTWQSLDRGVASSTCPPARRSGWGWLMGLRTR